jgi:lysyl-tRNA synthetase class II
MLEFYWAYADVNQMMEFCERLIRTTVFKVLGRTSLRYGELELDFSKPFARLTMKEAVAHHWPAFWKQLSNERFDIDWLSDPYQLRRLIVFLDLMEKEVAKKNGRRSAYPGRMANRRGPGRTRDTERSNLERERATRRIFRRVKRRNAA